MFTNTKIGVRLLCGFCTVVLFMAIIGISSYLGNAKLMSYADDLANSHAIILDLSQSNRAEINLLRRFEKDAFINITDQAKVDEYRNKWEKSRTRLLEQLDSLTKLVDTAGEREALAAIRKNVELYCAGFQAVCERIKKGEITTTQDANTAISSHKDATHNSEKLVTDFSTMQYKELKEQVAVTHAAGVRINAIVIVMTLVAMVLALLISFLISRTITVPLGRLVTLATSIASGNLTSRIEVTSKDETGQLMAAMKTMSENLRRIIGEVTNSASEVASSANQIYTTTEKIATGSEEVAAQSATVATAGEEMSATSGDIAQNCQMASEGAQRASESARNGSQVVERTVTVMGEIASKVMETAQTVESLGARSDQIGAIIGTIEDIADQTNLLALNAAIEAARAGEMGRGFAVVADEVRALAERTTRATKEIGEMIKAIQKETRGAVTAMEQGVRQVENGTAEAAKSGDALREILEHVNDVALQVNQIATAAEEQTATTSEISSNIHQITDVVHATSEGAQESAAAASHLKGNAEELQRLVRQFTL